MKHTIPKNPSKNTTNDWIPESANLLHLGLHLLILIVGMIILHESILAFADRVHATKAFGLFDTNSSREAASNIWLGIELVVGFIFWTGLLVSTGSRLRALGNIVHECSHNIFLKDPRANEFLGNILAVLLLQSFQKYRDDHRTHHKYLGIVGLQKCDRDLARYQNLFQNRGTENILRRQLALAWRPQNLKVAYQITLWNKSDHLHTNRLRVVYAAALLLGIGLLFNQAAAGTNGLHNALRCMGVAVALAPVFIIYPLFCVWSDIADHCIGAALHRRPNAFSLSRNHIFRSKILNLIFFPRNDAYHLVHHLFPSRPVSQYPAIHRRLLVEQPEYARLNHTLSILKIPKTAAQT